MLVPRTPRASVVCLLAAAFCAAWVGPAAAEELGREARHATLAEARAEATRRGVPVLLLVGLPRAECPPVVRLEDLFLRGEALERIRELAVPARLVTGGMNPSPEVQEFSQRYGPLVTPSFFLLAPDGDVLHAQVGGLYGAYAEDQSPLATPPVKLLSVDELLGVVRAAVARDAQQRARLTATVGSGDAAVVVERAEILAARGRLEPALHEARRAVALVPGPDLGVRLARVFVAGHAKQEAAAALARLAAAHPAHRDRILWSVLAKAYDPTLAGSPPWPELIGAARADGRAAVAALAEVHAVLADPAALEALEADRRPLQAWFAALTLLPVEGEAALSELASRAAGPRSRLEAMERLLETFPDAASAQHGKHGMLDLLRRHAARPPESAPR
jgi:hypothetical protein